MSVFNQKDLTQKYKQNVYNIALDVSGWDTVTFQVVAPVAAPLYIYATIDDNMPQGQLLSPNNNYKAANAANWSPVQAVQLATGSAVTSISTAGLYSVPVNAPYLKVGGGGANVYGLWQNNLKIG
jgi:hypothetical protein